MTTRDLVEQLLTRTADAPDADTVDILHDLLDDSTVNQTDPPLGISDAAALVGLSTHTLRYYEDQGLVTPSRDPVGYRTYTASDLRRLVFLTRMRLSGMGMAELRRYVTLVEQGDATVPERRAIMVAQRDRIRRQLRELTLALETTEYKIRVYTPED